ncbi:MAG: 16S rRNA (guanine(527)-N(7))-methyltransferase RsmG [Amaricoccus sp.]|uniref:16S rRNA (guanine(527)-N(7))-methyltransferase RsmG n=1 Tax=Amaricoccus sp. TaxID=1872485 RepID=UPI0039E394AA
MNFTRESFQQQFDVSRETMERLDVYVALLQKWSPTINLVSRESLGDVWHRHIADSAQLWRLRPANASHWLDLGSGAGFPGLVAAALAADSPSVTFRLVESDERKSAFLHTVIREASLPAEIVTTRIERLPAQSADVVSARALAPLSALLGMVQKHRRPGGIGLFPKGRAVHKEIEEARTLWRFDPRVYPSLTDPTAGIVEIGVLDRV